MRILAVFFLLSTLAFETVVFGATRLDFESEAKHFVHGDFNYYKLSIDGDHPLQTVTLKTNSDGELIGYHLEWKELPESNEIVLYKKDLPEPVQKLGELRGSIRPDDPFLDQLARPNATGFNFINAEGALEGLSRRDISSEQRSELEKEWQGIYFGAEEQNAQESQRDLKNLKDASQSQVEVKTLIRSLTRARKADGSTNPYSEFNQLALQDIEARATFVATRFELFGSGHRRRHNSIRFNDIPHKRIEQSLDFWPDYLQELSRGVQSNSAPLKDLQITTGEPENDPADLRAPQTQSSDI